MLWTQPATVALLPPFRLLCQVARAVVSAIAVAIVRRFYIKCPCSAKNLEALNISSLASS
ncbi:MAG: hypothetical protein V7K44_27010 [Nostoc sp.]